MSLGQDLKKQDGGVKVKSGLENDEVWFFCLVGAWFSMKYWTVFV